jgi:hypothetical protein
MLATGSHTTISGVDDLLQRPRARIISSNYAENGIALTYARHGVSV